MSLKRRSDDRHTDRQTDASDFIICPMLCYSNGTDNDLNWVELTSNLTSDTDSVGENWTFEPVVWQRVNNRAAVGRCSAAAAAGQRSAAVSRRVTSVEMTSTTTTHRDVLTSTITTVIAAAALCSTAASVHSAHRGGTITVSDQLNCLIVTLNDQCGSYDYLFTTKINSVYRLTKFRNVVKRYVDCCCKWIISVWFTCRPGELFNIEEAWINFVTASKWPEISVKDGSTSLTGIYAAFKPACNLEVSKL